MSDGNEPRDDRARKDLPGVIAPPPLIYGVPLALLLFIHDRLAGACDVPLRHFSWPARAFSGAVVVIAGALLIVTAILAMRRADTPPEPWEETRALALSGPYRLTRNPMYLGMAFAYAGIAIIAGCLLMLAGLVPVLFVIDRYVIAREEAYLARKFGASYTAWLARSKRWL
ncbi:methyltransferase family protein [Sphingomicrobium astaxanthinifaciens]|uniref:methyltransferase family protein n=1 Tax=Sphingomicrobium astaxanthinifaciens TaxID=1227949 RepID=UPI001FCB8394|nr:isoprenylcysteine carboxylmethyltransferase family protein [Sphingomicrobium astaxanthinifaciens]MCJ7421616.1 isoprenylcysteine carboxylmethyltransferase family protein [Sphingomicrobium astaxanthinifaciens]